jgi:aldehyde:ferredoxin oxidoreductase
LGARACEDAIRDEMGSSKIRVAQTGLAGMNGVLYANITNNLSNFNGRNGMGALMGSKNVRAVAVLGSQKLEFADPDYLRQTAKDFAKTFRNNPAGEALHVYGTTAFPEILSAAGALPVENFRRSSHEDAALIGGDTYNEILLNKRKGCHACPIQCKRGVALDHPKYGIDSRYGGPEYETLAALGSNLNITNLKAVAKGNEICNRYCMDTVTAGMTIAFACECYEAGIVSKSDTGGLELKFGDADLMLKLLEMIAHRDGFGDDLAQGSARLADKWGVTDQPLHLSVKGMEPAMHDPRVKVGVGLGYAVCTYGADHMNAAHDPAFVDPQSFSFNSAKPLGIYEPVPSTEISPAKIRNTIILERFWKVLDALGLCVFGYAPRSVMPVNQMVRCVNAVTGWNTSLLELMNAGERSVAMARVFNSREGFTIKDDKLPKRLFDPKPDGPNAGEQIFTEEKFNDAVKQYYEMMGLDSVSGRPLRGKLLELGLEWVETL